MAIFSLYKKNENPSTLHEAAACFKGASEVYVQLGRGDKAMVAVFPKKTAEHLGSAVFGFKAKMIVFYLFWRFSIRSSTTAGSARVDVSPREVKSFSPILRKMRRMILPERVFGRPGAH